MMDQLWRGKVSLPPLSLRPLKMGRSGSAESRYDAWLEISWGGKKGKFAVECKALSTPLAFEDALNRIQSTTLPKGYRPILFMPFLGEWQLQKLAKEGLSGLDLCGNGVVIAPGEFSVFHGGEDNRFPASAPIKNIYRNNSAMAGRVFLARPVFNLVQEIRMEINRRNPLVTHGEKKPMSLSTVSKALKALAEDLIVKRNGGIRLLQPEKLLEKLVLNYVPPKITQRVRIKFSKEIGDVRGLLSKLSRELGAPLVAAGTSSVSQYAVMQRGDMLSVYCPRAEPVAARLSGSRADRFPDLELIETEEESVFFDARQKGNFWWASPAQTYLELMAGDKRDQETAEQVKSFLLMNLKPELP